MCTNPRYIRRPDGSRMQVGCGHCLQCLKAYQDGWTARLSEELKSWRPVLQDGRQLLPVIFFTLDYRPEAIPCTYLLVTDNGVRWSETKPECEILQMWTDTTHETKYQWLRRREEILRRYMSAVHYVWESTERRASVQDFRDGNYKFVGFMRPGVGYDFCCDDFPGAYIPRLKKYRENATLAHPDGMVDVLQDTAGIGTPFLALEFHSVFKDHVQKWNKRGRSALAYKYPNIFDQVVNPRFNPFWKDRDGVDHELPTCAQPKNTKFFITSEYGPATHRPHYHGVMFGVTYDEFQECFACDWNKRFGRCKFDILNPSAGGMMYVSKYCSKGGYEHPYCCKDIIYPDSGLEYHSKDCFNCVNDFGVPFPMVRPTFHLISKGIGAAYAFKSEIQQYFASVLTEYLTPSGNLKYSCSDGLMIDRTRPSLDWSRFLCLNDDDESLSKLTKVLIDDNGDILVHKFDSNGRLVGESFIEHTAVINTVVENMLNQTLYSRTYVTYQKTVGTSVPSACIPCWHKIGLTRISSPVTKCTSITLPRYYRQWLVSPLASFLRQSAAVRLHPSAYETASRMLQDGRPYDEVASWFSSFMDCEKIRNQAITERLWRSARNLYSPSGHKNLD